MLPRTKGTYFALWEYDWGSKDDWMGSVGIPAISPDIPIWKVIGIDEIQLLSANGATMELTFTDENKFSGLSWTNANVAGTKIPAQ